jgi:ParB-like chromosome segregation protein Spo0J
MENMEAELAELKLKTDNTVKEIEEQIKKTESEMILRRDNLFNEIEQSLLSRKKDNEEIIK